MILHFADIIYLDVDGFEHEGSIFLRLVLESPARPLLEHGLLDFSVILTIVAHRGKFHFGQLALELVVKRTYCEFSRRLPRVNRFPLVHFRLNRPLVQHYPLPSFRYLTHNDNNQFIT